MMKRASTPAALLLATMLVALTHATGEAQAPRMVEVDGFAMRVWTDGLDERQPGEPVVVFENGGGAPIEGWGDFPSRIAALAPVVAYDRSTVGESEWDGEDATPEHVASRLRALLDTLGAAPPYVLVGWSYGGDLVRHHVGLYPDDIAGVVYVDPAILSPAAAVRVLEAVGSGLEEHRRTQEVLAHRFETLPPRLQADLRLRRDLYRDHVEQEFPPAPSVPTSVVLAGRYQPPSAQEVQALGPVPYDRRAAYEAAVRDRTDRLRDWVIQAPGGVFAIAGNSGHPVHIEAPALVEEAVAAVLFPDPTPALVGALDRGDMEDLREAYEALERRYPPERFGEDVLNRVGYRLLGAERVEDAIAVFRDNVDRHPDAWNPHDSLGDAYVAAGRIDEAIAAYRRSLELNPNSPSGAKLRSLEGG